MSRRDLVLPVAALLAVAGAFAATAPAAGGAMRENTEVTVVQGIPGKVLDVYVGMHKLDSGLKFGSVATSMIAPGHYDISFRLHGMAETTKPVATLMERLLAGSNDALVLGLGKTNKAAVSVFMNPTSHVAMGDGRVIVRNVAHAGAVDVYLNAKREEKALAEGESTMALPVKAGMYSLKLDASGTMRSLVGPTHITVKDGGTVIAYFLGSEMNKMVRVDVESY